MKKDFIWYLERIMIWIAVIITFILSMLCLFTTNYADATPLHIAKIKTDNFIISILIFITAVVVFTVIREFLKKKKITIKECYACVFMMLFVFIMGNIWIFTVKCISTTDQRTVVKSAVAFIAGDYTILEKGYYMYIYPFQLGLAAYTELVFRIIGRESDRALQMINVLSVPFTYFFLYKISNRIFKNKTTNLLTIILCIACLPLFFFTPFVYGDVITQTLVVAAAYFSLKYMDTRKIRWSILVIVLITIATQLKTNTLIAAIAFMILYVFFGIRERKPVIIAQAVILFACIQLVQTGVVTFYEARSGIELTDGAPRTLHIAMGLQEGTRSAGQYNGFSLNPYVDNDCNAQVANAIAVESIKESIKTFAADPAYMLDFFYRKISSEWVDPTYNSFFSTDYYCQPLTGVAKSIYSGDLNTVVEEFMNQYQFLLIFCSCGFFFLKRRKITLDQMGLMIIFLGGFAFHIIWEANGRYCLPYFVLLIPYGAAGMREFMDLTGRHLPGAKKEKLQEMSGTDNLTIKSEDQETDFYEIEEIPTTLEATFNQVFDEKFEISYEDPYAMPDEQSMRE